MYAEQYSYPILPGMVPISRNKYEKFNEMRVRVLTNLTFGSGKFKSGICLEIASVICFVDIRRLFQLLCIQLWKPFLYTNSVTK